MNICDNILFDFNVKKQSVTILWIFTVQRQGWLLNWMAVVITNRNKSEKMQLEQQI